jgi:hypothetical protein
MFSVIYLEQKVLTRNAFTLAIEKQVDCKVIYACGDVHDFLNYIQELYVSKDILFDNLSDEEIFIKKKKIFFIN